MDLFLALIAEITKDYIFHECVRLSLRLRSATKERVKAERSQLLSTFEMICSSLLKPET